MTKSENRYEIILRGDGKFYVKLINNNMSCMIGAEYVNSLQDAFQVLETHKEEERNYVKNNKQTIVHSEVYPPENSAENHYNCPEKLVGKEYILKQSTKIPTLAEDILNLHKPDNSAENPNFKGLYPSIYYIHCQKCGKVKSNGVFLADWVCEKCNKPVEITLKFTNIIPSDKCCVLGFNGERYAVIYNDINYGMKENRWKVEQDNKEFHPEFWAELPSKIEFKGEI